MSELVEKVARSISPAFMDGNLRFSAQNELARAAIAAVAEWLDAFHKAEYLQSENHASPALRAELQRLRGDK